MATWPVDETSVSEATNAYAAYGFKTHPIFGMRPDGTCQCGGRPDCAPGKHPIWPKWQARASADPERTRAAFAGHTGNVAIYCDNRLVLIDVDGAAGRESVAQLGELPETLTARTGSGGAHYIYRLQPWQDPSQITDRKIAPGLDIKVRGYFLVAPSLHKSGQLYQWTTPRHPDFLTDHLYAKIRKAIAPPRPTSMRSSNADKHRAREYLKRVPPAISGQRGHDQLFQAALKVATLETADAMDLLWEYNDKCVPQWTDKDLEHKLEEAKTKGRNIGIKDRPRESARVEPIRDGIEIPDESWKSNLHWEERKGMPFLPKGSANQIAFLRHDPSWHGKIRLNEFAQEIEVTDPPWIDVVEPGTRFIRSTDSKMLSEWYQRRHQFIVGTTEAWESLCAVAQSNRYNPARDWMDSLVWDGVPRLITWLSHYLGAEQSEYTALVGRWWLISAVARTYVPGCKVDHMLQLEGVKQGEGKSTALNTLAGDEWFSDTPFDLNKTQESGQAIAGVLIYEFGEMSSMGRADVGRIKGFCSSRNDKFRVPWGKVAEPHPRRCVFAATTNHNQSFRDETGNRRFWPVKTGAHLLKELAQDRDQLWAEAVAAYQAGECWWPTENSERALMSEQQDARVIRDAWEPQIQEWIEREGLNVVDIRQILKEAIRMDPGQWEERHQQRAGKVMCLLGWERFRDKAHDPERWAYKRPGHIIP